MCPPGPHNLHLPIFLLSEPCYSLYPPPGSCRHLSLQSLSCAFSHLRSLIPSVVWSVRQQVFAERLFCPDLCWTWSCPQSAPSLQRKTSAEARHCKRGMFCRSQGSNFVWILSVPDSHPLGAHHSCARCWLPTLSAHRSHWSVPVCRLETLGRKCPQASTNN